MSRATGGLIIFLAFAFGLSWVAWMARWALDEPWEGWGRVLFYVGGCAPSVGGIVATWWAVGPRGAANLLASAAKFWVSPLWWAFIVLVPLSWVLASGYLFQAVQGQPLGAIDWSVTANWISLHAALMLIPPLGEEFGWRGYLLPRLMARRSIFVSVLMLGVIWGVWHFPLYADRIAQHGLIFPLAFAWAATMMGVLLAVVLLRTRSLLLVMLMHFAYNLVQEWALIPSVSPGEDFGMLLICYAGVITALALAALPLLLTSDKAKFLAAFPTGEGAR